MTLPPMATVADARVDPVGHRADLPRGVDARHSWPVLAQFSFESASRYNVLQIPIASTTAASQRRTVSRSSACNAAASTSAMRSGSVRPSCPLTWGSVALSLQELRYRIY